MGVIYFSASIWPFMGIFIHAVDAETGEVLWTNSETGSQFTVHPHGATSFGSVVPQGYLTIAGDALIVPGGRSLPAVLDRDTGKVRHFDFGGKSSGGFDVIANDEMYVVRNDMLRLTDGKAVARVKSSVLDGDLLIGSAGSQGGKVTVQSTNGEITEKTVKGAEDAKNSASNLSRAFNSTSRSPMINRPRLC